MAHSHYGVQEGAGGRGRRQQENSKFQTRNVLIKSPVPHSVMILLADCM